MLWLVFLYFCDELRNALCSALLRYDLESKKFDLCPLGIDPQRTHENGIVWCQHDGDCLHGYSCTPIIGLLHFGQQLRYCCEKRTWICSMPPQPGYGECGKYPEKRFYFDMTRLRCTAFEVLECAGVNENRFNTIEQCEAMCERAVCPPGESLLKIRGKTKMCDSTACPSGYVCRYDALLRRHVCCGYSQKGACSLGYRTYMNASTGLPIRCSVNSMQDECPPDFLCTTPIGSAGSYCCALERVICPLGQSPYLHLLTSNSLKCDPSKLISECPNGFECTVPIAGALWGFCCSYEITASCPDGSVAFINTLTNMAERCTTGVSVCSSGFICATANEDSLIGFCCSVISPKGTVWSSESISLSSVHTLPSKVIRPTDGNEIRREHHDRRSSNSFFLYTNRYLRLRDMQKELDRQSGIKRKKARKRLIPRRSSSDPHCEDREGKYQTSHIHCSGMINLNGNGEWGTATTNGKKEN